MDLPLPVIYTLAELEGLDDEEEEARWVSIINRGYAGGKKVDKWMKGVARKMKTIHHRLTAYDNKNKNGEHR